MKKSIPYIGIIIIFGLVFYFLKQTVSIYGGDGGDLVAAALVFGVPHPPGYPLFTFISFLLTKIPLSTPAWRVGLLSSVSSILTLVIFYLILKELIKDNLSSFIATLILGTTYLFWLYSIVPEVFALNNLFFITLIFLLIKWVRYKKNKYLYLWFLIFGLSLTHHHTIILLLPSSIYLFLKYKKLFDRKILFFSMLSFLVGLIPLLYLPLSAKLNPPINWEDPTSFTNFWRLLTRAGYGTFKIGPFTGDSLIKRAVSLLIGLRSLILDFGLPSLFITVLGIFYCLKKNKDIFKFLGSLLIILFFFIYYASFPLVNDFLVGTFERFLLLPEIIFALFLGFGLKEILLLSKKFLGKLKISPRRVSLFISLIFFLIPLQLFLKNFPKISILARDTTVENLATDVLNSTEPNSILLLFTDTPLFSTQYMYYWQKKWESVKIIHTHKLQFAYYQKTLKKYYPDLYLPSPDSENFMQDFLKTNSKNFAIFSKEPPESADAKWIPQGLLVKYYPNDSKIPTTDEVISTNEKLWHSYSDPFSGSLKKYKNLILADVLRVYGVDHETYGLYLFENKKYKPAELEFQKALAYFPDTYTKLMLGQTFQAQNKCELAANIYLEIAKENPKLNEINLYLAETYASCFNDEQKKNDYLKIYEDKLKEQQLPLKKL